jgi:hypothetical protein
MKDLAQPGPYLEHVRLNSSKIHNAPMLATLYYVLNQREKMLDTLNTLEREGRQKNRQDGGFKEYLQFSKKFLAYVDTHSMHPS